MKFKDEIWPSIERIVQQRTYYGLIEGIPNQEINRSEIESAADRARRYLGVDTIHVIQPAAEILGPDSARLPDIVCMAELTYYKPMKDELSEASRLGLVWYQQEYAFPVAPEVLKAIGQLEWKVLSEDYYWS